MIETAVLLIAVFIFIFITVPTIANIAHKISVPFMNFAVIALTLTVILYIKGVI